MKLLIIILSILYFWEDTLPIKVQILEENKNLDTIIVYFAYRSETEIYSYFFYRDLGDQMYNKCDCFLMDSNSNFFKKGFYLDSQNIKLIKTNISSDNLFIRFSKEFKRNTIRQHKKYQRTLGKHHNKNKTFKKNFNKNFTGFYFYKFKAKLLIKNKRITPNKCFMWPTNDNKLIKLDEGEIFDVIKIIDLSIVSN